MRFYALGGGCFCPLDGLPAPQGAVPVDRPFGPLIFLVSRAPDSSRSIFAVRSWGDVLCSEGPELLKAAAPVSPPEQGEALQALMNKGQVMAVNRAFPKWKNIAAPPAIDLTRRLRTHIAGLGDVGGTLLTGLKLLGGNRLSAIGIFDPDERRCARYEQELNQILPLSSGTPLPPVEIVSEKDLFDCDLLVFTASMGVPPVTESAFGQDVRLTQYERNREILLPYARRAREEHFSGLFAVVSDPVDQLCRALFEESNRDKSGKPDYLGLLPEQVRGYGLGVMAARADYIERRRGRGGFLARGRAFGPHGKGLVIANALGSDYDDAYSILLTEQVETANHAVRATGYKPYIAPGLSSACVSILQTICGEFHYAATPMGKAYFGCRCEIGLNGPALEQTELPEALFSRIAASHRALEEFPC